MCLTQNLWAVSMCFMSEDAQWFHVSQPKRALGITTDLYIVLNTIIILKYLQYKVKNVPVLQITFKSSVHSFKRYIP